MSILSALINVQFANRFVEHSSFPKPETQERWLILQESMYSICVSLICHQMKTKYAKLFSQGINNENIYLDEHHCLSLCRSTFLFSFLRLYLYLSASLFVCLPFCLTSWLAGFCPYVLLCLSNFFSFPLHSCSLSLPIPASSEARPKKSEGGTREKTERTQTHQETQECESHQETQNWEERKEEEREEE